MSLRTLWNKFAWQATESLNPSLDRKTCESDATCCMYAFFHWAEFKYFGRSAVSCRLTRNGLVMQKLNPYEIPLTVKAQVVKSNQVREGLR